MPLFGYYVKYSNGGGDCAIVSAINQEAANCRVAEIAGDDAVAADPVSVEELLYNQYDGAAFLTTERGGI